MFKDFPLKMELSSFRKLSIESREQIKKEIHKKLNQIHGPVVRDYAEMVEDENLLIIHNIVEIQAKSPLNINDKCGGRCGNNCDNC